MKPEATEVGGELRPACNVNSTFNFTVGALAIAAALLIGYLVYVYLRK